MLLIKKQAQQLETSLNDVLTVSEDLLKTFCKLFYLRFYVSSDK